MGSVKRGRRLSGLIDLRLAMRLHQGFHAFLAAPAASANAKGIGKGGATVVAVFNRGNEFTVGNALANTNVHSDGIRKSC